ncbi:NADP-dependent oxidoreductase [Caballeronia sp. GAWG2-1]|uniref:NADP-dependent oxidoreductase n=1 Tax=Caballeronia sp. GAWG2-1 TaxID=2921744 RepID=UPI002027DF47|nr:NADP-dependent oxidoreductase [Caballeronia sp. GAWG2-1]
MRNRRWALASHAQGAVSESLWKLEETDASRPAERQILVKTLWLSVDPYMRGKLNEGAGMQAGSLMQGGGVGEVVESNHPEWRVGDIAESPDVGWQDYAVLTPDLPGASKVNKVDTRFAPPQAALSWLGMPGLTAYFAMLDVGRPKPGDTVVVSAAAGAVGQIAGQLARLAGCRVIGIAGSDRKLDWCKTIGFNETINYKSASDLAAEVARCCPNGVNVFFDGTGGPIHDAVLKNLAIGARVAIVGRVAVANNSGGEDTGLRASSRLIATRAVVQGFVVYDWWHRRDEALQRLAAWHKSGELQFREDVLSGLENVPRAFMRMMAGENFGKQLVQV